MSTSGHIDPDSIQINFWVRCRQALRNAWYAIETKTETYVIWHTMHSVKPVSTLHPKIYLD